MDEQDDQEVIHDCILQAVSGKLHLFDCYGYARWDFVSGPKIECLWRSFEEDRSSTLEDIRPLIYMLLCPEVARSMHLLQEDLDVPVSSKDLHTLWHTLRQESKRKFLQNQAYQKTSSCVVFPTIDVFSRRPAVGCFFGLSSAEIITFCMDVHEFACDQLINIAEAFLRVHLAEEPTVIRSDRRSAPLRDAVVAAFSSVPAARRRPDSAATGKIQSNYLHIDSLVRNLHLVTSALYQQSFLSPLMGEVFQKNCSVLEDTFDSSFLATAVSAFLLNDCRAVVVGKCANSTQLLLHMMLLFSTKSSTAALSFLVPFTNVVSFGGSTKTWKSDYNWHECGANHIHLQSFESPFHLARVNKSEAPVLILNVDKRRIIRLPPDAPVAHQVDHAEPARRISLKHSLNNHPLKAPHDLGDNAFTHVFGGNGNFHMYYDGYNKRREVITILDIKERSRNSTACSSPAQKRPFSMRIYEICDKLRQLSADEMETDLLNELVLPFKFFIDDLAVQLEDASEQAAKHAARIPVPLARAVSNNTVKINSNQLSVVASQPNHVNFSVAGERNNVVAPTRNDTESWERVALCALLGKLDKINAYDVCFALLLAERRKAGVMSAFRQLLPHIDKILF